MIFLPIGVQYPFKTIFSKCAISIYLYPITCKMMWIDIIDIPRYIDFRFWAFYLCPIMEDERLKIKVSFCFSCWLGKFLEDDKIIIAFRTPFISSDL